MNINSLNIHFIENYHGSGDSYNKQENNEFSYYVKEREEIEKKILIDNNKWSNYSKSGKNNRFNI